MRKHSKNLSETLIIPAFIFLAIGMIFVTLPQAFATTINVTREISAPINQVWGIISNVDNETQYWSTYK